jgi:hypothetical protein
MAVRELLTVHSRIFELMGGWDRHTKVLRDYAAKIMILCCNK